MFEQISKLGWLTLDDYVIHKTPRPMVVTLLGFSLHVILWDSDFNLILCDSNFLMIPIST